MAFRVWVPFRIEEDVMSKRSGLSRGDRRRNARLERLRSVVRFELGIAAIDLADDTQVVVCRDPPRLNAT